MIGSAYRRLAGSLYDRWFRPAEAAGLSVIRAGLLRETSGATVEIGAGTGLNLAHYPLDLVDLVLTEPDPTMARQLSARRARAGRPTRQLRTPAEALPMADASMDVVVATFALCTVDDPRLALMEARRVLKPGGRLLFLEHVRSDVRRSARWQDRLAPAWRVVSVGCRCNQDTMELIRQAGFRVDDVVTGELPKAAPLWRPYVAGTAWAP